MDLLLMVEADNVVLWKGNNLFCNFVYTHPSTSLVFYQIQVLVRPLCSFVGTRILLEVKIFKMKTPALI